MALSALADSSLVRKHKPQLTLPGQVVPFCVLFKIERERTKGRTRVFNVPLPMEPSHFKRFSKVFYAYFYLYLRVGIGTT